MRDLKFIFVSALFFSSMLASAATKGLEGTYMLIDKQTNRTVVLNADGTALWSYHNRNNNNRYDYDQSMKWVEEGTRIHLQYVETDEDGKEKVLSGEDVIFERVGNKLYRQGTDEEYKKR